MVFKTEQEEFWHGDFGNNYITRNASDKIIASNVAFFARVLRRAGCLRNCMEFGANVGLNLRALRMIYPELQCHAVEINPSAAAELAKLIPSENVRLSSILDFVPTQKFDLVLFKGVLIHINPDFLSIAYRIAYETTAKYLMICEYYNRTSVQVVYRGHRNRLFKRDFCGDLLDAFPRLSLVDYGFCYRRDPNFPQDDVTRFLMEKRG